MGSNFIVMVSCSSEFISNGTCKVIGSNRPSRSTFCKRTLFGLSIGSISCFIGLIIMLGILLGTKGSSKKKNNNVVNHNVNAILQIEVVFSFMITVSWAFAVSYITGVHGPGTNIGNLYYFTWISFFSALIILFNCLSHMKPDSEEEEEGNNND